MNKTRNWILLTIFFLITVGGIWVLHLFTAGADFASSFLNIDSARFVPQDGSAPFEVDLNSYDLPRLDGVYEYRSTFSFEQAETVSQLTLRFGTGEATLSVDGQFVCALSVAPYEHMINLPIVSADFFTDADGSTHELTLSIRYADQENFIFPPAIKMEDQNQLDRHSAAIVNVSALPAGMLGITFLLITGLFLLGLSRSQPDYRLLLLALGTLSFCLNLLWGTGAYFPSNYSTQTLHFWDFLVYITAVTLLLYVFLNRKSPFFHYFVVILLILAGLILTAHVLTLLVETAPSFVAATGMLVDMLYSNSFRSIVTLATEYLILACAIAALLQHTQHLAQAALERTLAQAQAKVIRSGYENIVSNVQRTAAVHHEWKHDLMALDMLYRQGRMDELGAYLKERNNQAAQFDQMRFTENYVFDVLLSAAFARAQHMGIPLKATVNVPKTLNIRDEDLCSLLMNMLENALNACEAVEDHPFIRFSAELKGRFLAIHCENTTNPDAQKKNQNDPSHGWGLKNMREICQRYGSDLLITDDGTVFTVKTALQVGGAEPADPAKKEGEPFVPGSGL